MPYDLVPESVSRYTVHGDSSFAGGDASYIGQFYDPTGNYGYQNLFKAKWQSISASYTADEAMYRRFVYSHYMDLPDGFSAADSIFNDDYYEYISSEEIQTGKSTLDEMTVFNRKLYYIRNWLRRNCTYSLSAGKLPAGEDFVENFLRDRKGSCSHFASTAVLLCRYAGIPARYVEGYIIKPGDFPSSSYTTDPKPVNVTDYRAHAWVEIYIDGFGWYPMEFTSGYGNVRTAIPTETAVSLVSETEISLNQEAQPEDHPDAPDTTTAEQAGNPQPEGNTASAASSAETTIPAADSTVTETTSVPAEEQTAETETSPQSAEASEPTIGFRAFGLTGGETADKVYDITVPIIILILMLLIPALFVLRRRLAISIYRRKCALGEKSAVFAAYRKFGKILRVMKLPEQGGLDYSEYAEMLSKRSELLDHGTAETVIGVTLKAYFGGSVLTPDDAEDTVLAVNTLAKRYYGTLSKFGRFSLKYIYCII